MTVNRSDLNRMLIQDFENGCADNAMTEPSTLPPALLAAIPGLEAAIRDDGRLIP